MVDTDQLVLGIVAVFIIVLIPIGFVVGYDALAGRWNHVFAGWRQRSEERAEHRRNIKALRRQSGTPIEQLAADLRRLRAAVGADAHRSAAHQMGNRLAYDRVLTQVCAMLDIEHDLSTDLRGLERDIERVRVEAELERAGVVLSDRRFGQAA